VTNHPDATKASVADAEAITVGGIAIDGFDPDVSTYVVDWPENAKIPALSAVPARSGARVRVTDGSSILSSTGSRFTTRTIKVASANGSVTRTYTVGFQRTDRDHRPVAAGGDGATGGSGGWPLSGMWGRRGSGAGSSGGAGLWSRATEWAEPREIPRAQGTK
jgi:hypothetical protein